MRMTPQGSAPIPRENSRKRLPAVRVNISLPSVLVTQAPDMLATHGFLGLSDYVQSCLRRDLGMDFMRTR